MKNKLPVLLVALTLGILLYFLLKSSDKSERVNIKHDMVLQQVEELGRLELVRYNIRDIIEYEKVREWLPNSKTALIVVGDVISCIDLSLITKEDVSIKDDSISIVLPYPEICHFKIDHSRSRVYDVRYGLWDAPKLVDDAYREAESQLYRQAMEMGLADNSRQSAVKIVSSLLHTLGFNKVNIEFSNRTQLMPEENPMKILSPAP